MLILLSVHTASSIVPQDYIVSYPSVTHSVGSIIHEKGWRVPRLRLEAIRIHGRMVRVNAVDTAGAVGKSVDGQKNEESGSSSGAVAVVMMHAIKVTRNSRKKSGDLFAKGSAPLTQFHLETHILTNFPRYLLPFFQNSDGWYASLVS
ncbi:hypothetical protein CVT25_015181 [Psilocybe cyanescens]|uniref:Uncharacterized protein n=1 Tax=Psilocybe cyanescens TaxID=93625 RepID=A0A409VZ71_PSICY|nr:hypothetical protein CVT25_015181 [Psilocybe cyanescens]